MGPLTTRINDTVGAHLRRMRLLLIEPRTLIALAVVAVGDVLLLVAITDDATALLSVLVWSSIAIIVFGLLMIKGIILAEDEAGLATQKAAEEQVEPSTNEELPEGTLEEITREFNEDRARLYKRGVEAMNKHLDAIRAAANRAIAKLNKNEEEKTWNH